MTQPEIWRMRMYRLMNEHMEAWLCQAHLVQNTKALVWTQHVVTYSYSPHKYAAGGSMLLSKTWSAVGDSGCCRHRS